MAMILCKLLCKHSKQITDSCKGEIIKKTKLMTVLFADADEHFIQLTQFKMRIFCVNDIRFHGTLVRQRNSICNGA